MTDVVEEDVPTGPLDVRPLGAAAVVPGAQGLAKLVKQLRLGTARRGLLAEAICQGLTPFLRHGDYTPPARRCQPLRRSSALGGHAGQQSQPSSLREPASTAPSAPWAWSLVAAGIALVVAALKDWLFGQK